MGASASMFDGVAGLSNHQQWMNIIGNNIANVNTAGFKDDLFNFADVISQTIRGASASIPGGPGGTDALQAGLGVGAGSVIGNQQQGSLQTTNVSTDFAIQGEGFFIVSDGVSNHYTRDANFIVDGFGNINMAATGLHLQGYGLKQVGNNVAIDSSKIVNLSVPQQINPAQQTNVLDMFGNLQSSTTTPQTQSIGVYDSLGQLHNVVLTFTPPTAAGGDWTVAATSNDLNAAAGWQINVTGGNATNQPVAPPAGSAGLHFNSLGQLDGVPTGLDLVFSNGAAVAGSPSTPWLIPGTTVATNAVQADVQVNTSDTNVGSLTSFASPTALQTQAVPNTTPLVGTQSATVVKLAQGSSLDDNVSPVNFDVNYADSNGLTHSMVLTATNGGAAQWTLSIASVDGDAALAGETITTAGGATVTLTTVAPGPPPVVTPGANLVQTIDIPANAYGTNTHQTFDIDFTNVASTANAAALSNASGVIVPSTASSGNSAGALKDFSVDKNGVLHGVYTNGFTQTIGQILLANVENPGGLVKEGNNVLQISANSGVVNVGTPGAGRFGTIAEGNIETSNVDLATEFSNMILAERGFQANSRIITTSDQMLQEVVDLKR
jgi:flagellar hook protein FlgE